MGNPVGPAATVRRAKQVLVSLVNALRIAPAWSAARTRNAETHAGHVRMERTATVVLAWLASALLTAAVLSAALTDYVVNRVALAPRV